MVPGSLASPEFHRPPILQDYGMKLVQITLLIVVSLILSTTTEAKTIRLLHVSYDPTRELYQDINSAFAQMWEARTGEKVQINQSHGGSGKQARSVIDGLEADVVSLALAFDIDAIQSKAGLLAHNWQQALPHNASPYTSTIVFVVRRGNPKSIKQWEDLIRSDVKVITPNPKTSGGARWNYLAAYGYAQRRYAGDVTKINNYIRALFKNVPVLDSGARGSTTTFAQRKIGDVLITWENEAYLLIKHLGKDQFETVAPNLSILAEPPVAVITKNAIKHGTFDLAKAYLEFLYTEPGQELIAKHDFRPRHASVMSRHSHRFLKQELLTIDGDFGGWQKAHADHFADGGSFDRIYAAGR